MPHSSAAHRMTRETRWVPEEAAEHVTPTILRSQSNSNSYLVVTPGGDVAVNTGTVFQAERHRERFEELLGRPLDVKAMVFTQSHPDHSGGWLAFGGDRPGVETIAHSEFPEGQDYRLRLIEFFWPRSQKIVGRKNKFNRPEVRASYSGAVDPVLSTVFEDSHSFVVGGETFELYSAPGGETLDGLVVWIPGSRTAFIGNLIGALPGQLPHLSTIRGDKPRSALRFISSVQRVIDLEPALLLSGHADAIEGTDAVRAYLTRARDATQYIHDETVRGMNAGKDLWTLMDEIELPPELAPPVGRGPVSWYVRAVWEEYAGWFRHESTTELYAVPPRAIWAELGELAGGPDVLAERAAAHVTAGRPLHALHFTDIALSIDPEHAPSREAKLNALRQLLEETGGDYFDVLAWLESEMLEAGASIDESGQVH
jgi:alkyl sulfatase BDS1-like metallo-beta-lactamase superfamily hydrolase